MCSVSSLSAGGHGRCLVKSWLHASVRVFSLIDYWTFAMDMPSPRGMLAREAILRFQWRCYLDGS